VPSSNFGCDSADGMSGCSVADGIVGSMAAGTVDVVETGAMLMGGQAWLVDTGVSDWSGWVALQLVVGMAVAVRCTALVVVWEELVGIVVLVVGKQVVGKLSCKMLALEKWRKCTKVLSHMHCHSMLSLTAMTLTPLTFTPC